MEVHGNDQGWGLSYDNIYNLNYQFCAIGRISVDAAANIRNIKETWDGQPPIGGGIITPIVDDSKAFEQYIVSDYEGEVEVNGNNNSSSFYYNGTPKKGKYLGKTEDENWIFDKLQNAADWLIGIITMNIKIQVVGWTGIFDSITNTIVEAISGAKDIDTRITVEQIIYNEVPVLDVNFFNTKTAGGVELDTNGSKEDGTYVIYMLRQKIANYYVIIRQVCIIILLLTLIYLGIRTAIDTVAKEKAGYKEKLVAWVVSFIIVMFIHYFMLFILNINELVISWVQPESTSQTATVYEQMRSYAYEIPATKGWTGAIMYVFLVYYLIKLLFFYFKRVLIVYILGIISPALGIAYSIQRINGKSKALGIWAKEFAFNVFIQFVHAIIFTVIMSFIIAAIPTAKVSDLIPYVVLLIIFLNFILKVEDIVKGIFKIQSNSLKSVIGTVFSLKNRFLPAVMATRYVYGKGKSAVVKQYEKKLQASLNTKYDKYKIQGDSEFAKATNAEIERLKEQEKKHIMELNSESIKYAKNQFASAVALVGTVPAVFEEPLSAVGTVTYAVSAVGQDFAGAPKSDANVSKLEASTTDEYLYIENPLNINDITLQNRTDKTEKEYVTKSGTIIRETVVTNEQTVVKGNVVSVDTDDTTSSKDKANKKNEKNTQGNADKPKIRKYNKKKNKQYRAVDSVISWATVGVSRRNARTKATRIREQNTIEVVYKTRIQKMAVIGNMAVVQENIINKELERIKDRNYPPIYYTPKKDERREQIAMSESLRKKYRDILRNNVEQVYEGANREKVAEHIVNYEKRKIYIKDVEEIAKDYLAEKECDIGETFNQNLHEELRERIISTVNKDNDRLERIKIDPEVEEKLRNALKENVEDKDKQNQEIDKILTNDVKENIVSKISTKDLTEIISSTLDKKGSIEMNRDFKNLQEPLETLRDLNKEAEVTTGNVLYSTNQIINLIMNKDIME